MAYVVCCEAAGERGKIPRRGKLPHSQRLLLLPKGFTMRLALKLVLAFMLANIVLAGIYGGLAVWGEVDQFKNCAAEEAQEMHEVLEKVMGQAWRRESDPDIQKSLDTLISAREEPVRVRWVLFDAKPESTFRPVAPPERLTVIVIQGHDPFEIEEFEGTDNLYVYWPVALTADRKGRLEFAFPETDLKAAMRGVIVRTTLLIGGMLLISGLVAVLLGVRLVGRPLEQLIAKVRRIGDGDLEGPVHLVSRDELAELAENLNGMCPS